MTQLSNQFGQSHEKGLLDLQFGGAVMSCQIDVSSAGGLVPGQAVKMVDSAGGVPKIVECSADADDVFGILVYDARRPSFSDYDVVEVACMHNSVIYMEASAAIARNAEVAIVIAGSKVVTAVSGDRIIGRALDKATAAGQLVRVALSLPGALKA